MGGKGLFKKYKVFIVVVGGVFKFFPKSICDFVWSLTSPFCGPLSLVIRYSILRSKAKSIGDNVYVGKFVILKNLSNLELGDNVSIHDGCYFDSFGGISIGNNVSIAHQTSIVSFEHSWSDSDLPIKYNPTLSNSISISDDVWIGCGVRILSGVSIGERCVVAAGSVVRGELFMRGLYAGVPVKRIKDI